MDAPQQDGSIQVGVSHATDGLRVCSYCGARNKEHFEYCVRCAESLDSDLTEAFVSPSASLPMVEILFLVSILSFVIIWVWKSAVLVPANPAAKTPKDAALVYTLPDEGPNLTNLDISKAGAKLKEALAAFRAGDYEMAVVFFEEAAKALPFNANVHRLLALSYYHLGDLERAVDAMTDAQQLTPQDYDVNNSLVRLHKESGDDIGAIALLQDYLRTVDEEDLDVRLELVRLFRKLDKPSVALLQSEWLYQFDSNDAEFTYEYAESLRQVGQTSAARELFKKAIVLQPDNGKPFHALGIVELQSGQLAKAVSLIEKALEREPSNPEFHFGLAQTYEKLDQIPESLAFYESYLEYATPSDPRAEIVHRQLKLAKIGWLKEQEALREGNDLF